MIRSFLILFCLILTFLQLNVMAQGSLQVPAEFEQNEGVLLVWDYHPARDSVVANIAGAIQDHAKVWIIYYPGSVPYDTTYIRNYLLSRGVGYHNVLFLPAWTNTLWIRDFGPVTGYKNQNGFNRHFFDLGYSAYNRPMDDSIPSQLANQWQIGLTNLPLQLEGGNLIFDGFKRAFGSKRILDQNAPLSEQQIRNILMNNFGLQDFYFLEKLLNSGGGIWMHVDMYMKMIDHETIMVSQYPPFLPDYPVIEGIIEEISTLQSTFGRKYNIERIPAPPKADGTYATTLNDEMRTYTNSLTINDVVVVPSYNLPMDTIARQIYEQVMPGYTIKMVDSRILTPMYGAIHCVTREVPQKDMLRIRHARKTGQQDYAYHEMMLPFDIYSKYIPDSVFVYWRIHPDTVFSQNVVYPTCSNYVAIITNLSPADTVTYYLEAHAQNTSITYPLVGPKGGFTFWFDATTGIPNHGVTNSPHVYPNPNSGSFHIDPTCNQSVDIYLFSLDGRLVYNELIHSATFVNLPETLQNGYYLLRWISGDSSGVTKLLLQR